MPHYDSFEALEQADIEEARRLSPEERLRNMVLLNRMAWGAKLDKPMDKTKVQIFIQKPKETLDDFFARTNVGQY